MKSTPPPSPIEPLEPRTLFSTPGDYLPNITDTATDAAGNVYRAGTFTGTLDFDPSAFNTILTAQSTDAYLAKFAADGTLLWARRWGNATPIAVPRIGVTPVGDVVLAADFRGTIDVDPSAATSNIVASGTHPNLFLVRLDTDAHLLRTNAFNTPGQDMLAVDVAPTPDGHVALVANSQVPGIQSSDDQKGDAHLYLLTARLRTTLHDRWAMPLASTPGVVEAFSLAVGPTGSIYISGGAQPGVDFAPGRRVRTVPGLQKDSPFLLRVAPTGRFDWVVGLDYGTAAPPNMIIDSVDANDDVLVAGSYTSGRVDFNPSPRKQFILTTPDNRPDGTYTALFSPRGGLISADDTTVLV